MSLFLYSSTYLLIYLSLFSALYLFISLSCRYRSLTFSCRHSLFSFYLSKYLLTLPLFFSSILPSPSIFASLSPYQCLMHLSLCLFSSLPRTLFLIYLSITIRTQDSYSTFYCAMHTEYTVK